MKRIFAIFSIVTATVVVTMTTTTYGQSSRVSEFKRRLIEQVNTAATKPSAESAKAADDEGMQSSRNYPLKNALVGTWDMVITFSDGVEVKSTLQILPGADLGEGSAIHASELSLAPPSPTLPEQGSWRYYQGEQFITSYAGYSFDEQLQPFGKVGFRHLITLGFNQEYFTGRAVFEVVDLTGKVLFSDKVHTVGKRHRAIAP